MTPEQIEAQEEREAEAHFARISTLTAMIDEACDEFDLDVVMAALTRQMAFILSCQDAECRTEMKYDLFKEIDEEMQWMVLEACDA